MNSNLFKAILSMDSYNRSYGAGIELDGNQIGDAVIVFDSEDLGFKLDSSGAPILDEEDNPIRKDVSAGFYAIAYSYAGETVISYRGTDQFPKLFDPNTWTPEVNKGWAIGAGYTADDAEQGQLAIEFYQQLAGAGNWQSAAISVTGHSLGGGLAGLVGGLYGKTSTLFDSMSFDASLQQTYDQSIDYLVNWTDNDDSEVHEGRKTLSELQTMQFDPDITVNSYDIYNEELRELAYGTNMPWAPTYPAGITSYALDGEVLDFLPDTNEIELSLGSDVDLVSGLDALALHSMSALVIRMYAGTDAASEAAFGDDWRHSAEYFWPILFDDTFAQSIGMPSFGGTRAADDDYSEILRTLIAYSAIDEGMRVFGDTGIVALYDDAKQLGSILNTSGASTVFETYGDAISRVYVEYAGKLAANKVLQSANGDAINGVLDVQGDLLTLNFSDTVWNLGAIGAGQIVSRSNLIDVLDLGVSHFALRTAMAHAYGEFGFSNVVEKASFVIDDAGDTYTLYEASSGKAHLFIAEPDNFTGGDDDVTGSSGNDIILTGSGEDVVLGGLGHDVIDGGEGDDVLQAQAGNDALIGGAGEDELYGGDGDDLLFVDTNLSVAEEEVYDGGDGFDRLDFKLFEKGLSYFADSDGTRIYEYGTSESDIRSGLELVNIEGYNLTDHADYLQIAVGATPLDIDTYAGNDEVKILGAGSTVNAGAGDDKLDLAGGSNTVDMGAGNDSASISGALNEVFTGAGSDKVRVTGNANLADTGADNDEVRIFGVGNEINTGAGSDLIHVSGSGNIVYTGANADKVNIEGVIALGEQTLLADISTEDRIYYAGTALNGGLKHIAQESAWIYDGMVKYGINQIGDLVIGGSFFDGQAFVSGFRNVLTGPFVGNIMLGEVASGAYNIFRADAEAPYGVTLGDTIENLATTIKALAHDANVEWDPLVLDLDGDGVETRPRSLGVYYDLNADGFAERTGWVSSDDGLLARDINSDGKIETTELFGNATTSGFTALSALDSNSDGVIDNLDASFGDLRIWRDLNQNGVSDTGELTTLSAHGIASINLTPTSTTATLQSGNTIAAQGLYTGANSQTGHVADVILDRQPYYSQWNTEVTITTEAAALPDLQGHGTLPSLREAMSYEPTLVASVETALAAMTGNSLGLLRTALTPLLFDWMDAITIPSGMAGTIARGDVAILATESDISGAQVNDYAIKVTDLSGSYWILASGDDVRDISNNVIERPTFNDVISQAGWSVLDGKVIQFFERWTGLNIPLGVEGGETGSSAVNAVQDMLTLFWAEMNTMAVRLAVQGPFASIFEGVAFDVGGDKFVATTDAQLVPMFENILQGSASLADVTAWAPFINVFLNDFERPNGAPVSYAWMYQNMVAAYENSGSLAYTLNQASVEIGIPSEQLVTVGTSESDLFYMNASNQSVSGGSGVDSYIFGRNFGQDTIIDSDGGTSYDHADSIRFAHYNPEDLIFSRDGNDLIIKVPMFLVWDTVTTSSLITLIIRHRVKSIL